MIRDLESLADGAGYDAVVLGSGAAGLAAALHAAIAGKSVLLVERTELIGGTTALSAGTVWVPMTRHADPSADSIENATRFLDRVVGNQSRAELRRAFLESGAAAIATLEDHSEVKFRPYALHPDYEQDAEGATLRGRALEPLPFDGRRLGRAFDLLRAPIPEFTILGGMMVDRADIGHLLRMTRSVASFRHAAGLLARHAVARIGRSRGTRLVMGNALVGRLLLSLLQRGVDILLGTSAVELVRGDDGIDGVVLEHAGARRRIAARLAVVLATGGFGRHATRRGELLRQPTPSVSPAAPGHTGAAQDLALALGARLGTGNAESAFYAPVSRRRRPDGSTVVFPHFVMDRSKPGTMCVNAAGRRFVNEATSYHEFARAMFDTHGQAPCIPAFLIADGTALGRYGLGMVRPGTRRLRPFLDDGYLVEAPTIAALARKLAIDAAALESTIAEMNAAAATGIDGAFGRGSTAYHRINGDPTHGPNPTLGALGRAPFYAIRLYPADIGAATGLVTDIDARVLDQADRPIGRLYACGADMHSIMGGTYPGPGITLGPAIVFAYRAIRHAVGSAERD